MNSITLLVERECTWSPEIWAEAVGGKRIGDDQVTIEQESEWLSIIQDDQVLDDFDDTECTRILELVGEPLVYVIEWKGNKLVERLLRSIPHNIRAAVDNDHGLLVPVDQVANKPLESWARAASLL